MYFKKMALNESPIKEETISTIPGLANVGIWSWFSDPDHSMNRKRKRFKVFKVGSRSNRDDVIINLIII